MIIGAGVAFLVLLSVVLHVYLLVLRSILRDQGRSLARAHSRAVVVSCTAALVTNQALKRIGSVSGKRYGRTGPVYSLAATRGHLLLLRGRNADVIADFGYEAVQDVRVGTTSWGFADYTTVFVGINAGGSTFELPIRVNGPRQTSPLTANRTWAKHLSAEIIREVKRS